MKKIKKNSKKDMLILLVIVLAVSALVFFVVKSVKNRSDLDSGNWIMVYDGDVSDKYARAYEPANYYTDVFNTISSGSDKRYTYVYPEDVNINTMAFGNLSFYGSSTEIVFHSITIDDFEDFEKETYERHKSLYDNVSMEKKQIDIDGLKSIVYLIKGSEDKLYYEELNMYIQEEDNGYLEVSYITSQTSFSDTFIKKVLEGFKIEDGKADKESCILKDDLYSCELNFYDYYGINRAFKFEVDGSKYFYEGDVSHYINDTLKFDKAYENDEDVDINWENVTINVVYSKRHDILQFIGKYDFGHNIITNDYVEIDGKKLLKVQYEVEEGYSNEAYYVDQITDHLALVIYIVTPDDPDDIVTNFLNYKISNPVNEY